MQWVAVVAVWKSQDGSVYRRCGNRKVVQAGAVQVHWNLYWLSDRGVRFRVATSPPPQLPLFCLVAGGSLVNMVPDNLVARKNQSKWVPPQILRALDEHPASKPLGIYYPAGFPR
ncbi:MAG: hypothetical protein VX346_01155 [Planctomycetota bacterium]|nr:hypothetical protein [Planctomycetota bacterium]